MALAVARWITRPDRLRADQSHGILKIADESLAHLRRGLDEETAQAVCDIVLERTDAAAIAITDTKRILGVRRDRRRAPPRRQPHPDRGHTGGGRAR